MAKRRKASGLPSCSQPQDDPRADYARTMGIREERISVVLVAVGGQAGLEEATRKELATDGISP